jgi:uncharacterized protein
MDLFADPALRNEVSPFLDLLWRRGRAHEEKIIASIAAPALNIRKLSLQERESATLEAIACKEPIIYGARILSGDLLGEPDLLRLEDGKYVPGDIKSGAAEEGPTGEDTKPKKHYGVQLALYVDILERLNSSAGRRGFILDIHGDEVKYDLTAQKGTRTPSSLWDDYQECLAVAREIIAGIRNPGAAYHSECKYCVWYSACLTELDAKDDLTLLPGLGRKIRQAFLMYAATSADLASIPPERFVDEKGKSILPGVGPDSIAKYHARATLKATGGGPYLTFRFPFPSNAIELFFDIETDPMNDLCYLHGFVERRNRASGCEQYFGFFAATPDSDGEREAFTAAYAYLAHSMPCTVYTYSKYERTWWRRLQQKYPDVCSIEEIEAVFASGTGVDLLEVVETSTEWPTRDHSIKTLAQYLGFSWRDPHPSGAVSIEWYDRYRSGDALAKSRLLEYNEDDCRAMRVLRDAIESLPQTR